MKKILFFLLLILILSVVLQSNFQESISNPISSDTEIRIKLLSNKKLNKVDRNIKYEDDLIDKSEVYSDLIVDYIIDSEKTIKLLDYEKHNLLNKFNKSRVLFKHSGNIQFNNEDCKGITIYDSSGIIILNFEFDSEKNLSLNLPQGVNLFKTYNCSKSGALYATFTPNKVNVKKLITK